MVIQVCLLTFCRQKIIVLRGRYIYYLERIRCTWQYLNLYCLERLLIFLILVTTSMKFTGFSPLMVVSISLFTFFHVLCGQTYPSILVFWFLLETHHDIPCPLVMHYLYCDTKDFY